jgi:hypothetical protein
MTGWYPMDRHSPGDGDDVEEEYEPTHAGLSEEGALDLLNSLRDVVLSSQAAVDAYRRHTVTHRHTEEFCLGCAIDSLEAALAEPHVLDVV